MNTAQQNKVKTTLRELFQDSRGDKFKMIKGAAKSIFRPIQPADFEDVYLSISSDQGEYIKDIIIKQKPFYLQVEVG